MVAWGNPGGRILPPNLRDVVAIDAGNDHVLALKRNGTVVAWGHTSDGQTDVPPELSDVTAITAGSYHSLALKRDGTVVSWA